jgi:hypothetical protein
MVGVAITIMKPAPTATVSITYFNDFNVSAFAFVPLNLPTTTQTFENGTEQVQQKFQIVNESPYWLSLDSIPVYFGAGSAPTNVTLNWTPLDGLQIPSVGVLPPYWYYSGHITYLVGYVVPHGSLIMVVVYNRF